MGDWIWLISGLVESFGCRIMLKKFQGKWDPQSCTCFTMPLAASKLWEFIVGVWLIKWWWNFVEINHMISEVAQKVSPAMAQGKWHSLHKAPIFPHRQMNFSRGKIQLCYEMFL